MNEDFLQYLWKYKKFKLFNLKTTQQQEIILQNVGIHNTKNSGPDFFNALMTIDDQKWAGNVEVHYRSSDWFVHNHEIDCTYDNVILHVVWEDDMSIYRKDNTSIPTLQLKDYVCKDLLVEYHKLFKLTNKKWIPCEKQLSQVPRFIVDNWQERLFLERLEQKTMLILSFLRDSANDWEAVLFKLLAKNFGLQVNGEAFLSLANSLDFSLIRKCSNELCKLEALFFGQAGLLDDVIEDEYFKKLKNEYSFLKNKFRLSTNGIIPVQFFRLRPASFPTIRLAQLAALYFKNKTLFRDIISVNTVEEIYELFEIDINSFWNNHYTFNKQSKHRKKVLTKPFIDLILINTIIPFKFIYARDHGKNPEEEVFKLICDLPHEKNSIIDSFAALNVQIDNAMRSQAMVQLKKYYCDQRACLRCAVGNYLLNRDRNLG